MSKTKVAKQLVNHIAIVVDESTSMVGLQTKVVENLNNLLKKIQEESKKNKQLTKISLITFASVVNKPLFQNILSSDIENIDIADYNPDGSTALLDAVAKAIKVLEERHTHQPPHLGYDESYLVIVLTDGQENNSREYSSYKDGKRRFKQLLQKYQATDKWTFAWQVPQNGKDVVLDLGALPDNVTEWEQSASGLQKVTQQTQLGTSEYFGARSKGLSSVRSFYETDLSGVKPSTLKYTLDDLSKKYEVVNVDKDAQIRPFLLAKLGKFNKGENFYLLTKAETIQSYKNFLVMDKKTGKIYGGDEARDLLGLPKANVRVHPGDHGNYYVFVNSTSVNRKLLKGTKVLVKK